MKITAVCLGEANVLKGRKYKSGIDKAPRTGPVAVDTEGLLGDAICNREVHGGADQAVYLEGSLTLDWWAAALGRPLAPGAFGENLVIEGLDNRDVAIGDRLRIADVLLEVTAPRTPCATFAAHMGDSAFVRRYHKAARPGIYCRVLSGGFLEAGQPVEFMPRDGLRIAVPEVMASFARKIDEAERLRLLSVPIASRLREHLGA